MDAAALKQCFPMLRQTMHGKPLVYLDSGATAQKPDVVIDTIADFYRTHYATVHRSIYDIAANSSALFHDARVTAKRFLGAFSEEEIIFTRGTTESINLVAYSFGKAYLRPGDEVLISEVEHHSNIVPWQIACEDRGARLKVIPVLDTGAIDIDAYAALLSERTKIVSISHVSNFLGTINPIEKLVRMAHEYGAKVLVDGAQAAPHMPVNVNDLGADFYVFSGHKAYGPTGIGVLYGKKELLAAMPPYQGGGDMIDKVTFEKTTYNALPLKFEAGTPLIAEAVGLGAALKFIEDVGQSALYRHAEELVSSAIEQLVEIPSLHIYGSTSERGALVSFNVEGIHHLDLGALLDLEGIAVRTGHLCAQPAMRRFSTTGVVRASFGCYNTLDDVDRFGEALSRVVKKLQCA